MLLLLSKTLGILISAIYLLIIPVVNVYHNAHSKGRRCSLLRPTCERPSRAVMNSQLHRVFLHGCSFFVSVHLLTSVHVSKRRMQTMTPEVLPVMTSLLLRTKLLKIRSSKRRRLARLSSLTASNVHLPSRPIQLLILLAARVLPLTLRLMVNTLPSMMMDIIFSCRDW